MIYSFQNVLMFGDVAHAGAFRDSCVKFTDSFFKEFLERMSFCMKMKVIKLKSKIRNVLSQFLFHCVMTSLALLICLYNSPELNFKPLTAVSGLGFMCQATRFPPILTLICLAIGSH